MWEKNSFEKIHRMSVFLLNVTSILKEKKGYNIERNVKSICICLFQVEMNLLISLSDKCLIK